MIKNDPLIKFKGKLRKKLESDENWKVMKKTDEKDSEGVFNKKS
jgi:hypothetical protein